MKSVSARRGCGRLGDGALGDCTRDPGGLRNDVFAASELVRGDSPLSATDDDEPVAIAPGTGRLDDPGTGRGCATAWSLATASSGTDDGMEMPPPPLTGNSSAVL